MLMGGHVNRSNLLVGVKSMLLCGPSRSLTSRSATACSEENKVNVETVADSFSQGRESRTVREPPWPLASSQSRSSPRAFTGFDERVPSRCVNHEPFRQFFESHPLLRETSRRRERDSTEGESFLRVQIHTPRARRNESDDGAPRKSPRATAVSLQNHEFGGKQRDVFRFFENRSRERLWSPVYCHFADIVSNVKHCNLNMDKAQRADFIAVSRQICNIHIYIGYTQFGVIDAFEILDATEIGNLKIWNRKANSNLQI